jgi:hypothetical protein
LNESFIEEKTDEDLKDSARSIVGNPTKLYLNGAQCFLRRVRMMLSTIKVFGGDNEEFIYNAMVIHHPLINQELKSSVETVAWI